MWHVVKCMAMPVSLFVAIATIFIACHVDQVTACVENGGSCQNHYDCCPTSTGLPVPCNENGKCQTPSSDQEQLFKKIQQDTGCKGIGGSCQSSKDCCSAPIPVVCTSKGQCGIKKDKSDADSSGAPGARGAPGAGSKGTPGAPGAPAAPGHTKAQGPESDEVWDTKPNECWSQRCTLICEWKESSEGGGDSGGGSGGGDSGGGEQNSGDSSDGGRLALGGSNDPDSRGSNHGIGSYQSENVGASNKGNPFARFV